MKVSDMCSTEGRLGAYLNTMVADLEIDGKGQYLRELFGKFYSEVCAAEEGGKLAKQTTNNARYAICKVCGKKWGKLNTPSHIKCTKCGSVWYQTATIA